MTALERAARAAALANEDEGCFDAISAYTPIVRAVLMAVREPDRKLSYIGAEYADDGGRYEQPMPCQCAAAFTAMIDAILNEENR